MDIKKENDEIIFSLSGELTLENENDYKDEILDKLESEDYSKVILDMSGLDYIDSSGIGMLVYLNKELRGENKSLILRSVTEPVMEIIKIGCFDEVLKIE